MEFGIFWEMDWKFAEVIPTKSGAKNIRKRGLLSSPKINVVTTPAILVLNGPEYWDHRNPTLALRPTRILRLGEEEYSLGAVIYGNGSHFTCYVAIKGGILFYDGVAKRKLKWQHAQSINLPTGYKVNQFWYIRRKMSPESVVAESVVADQSQPAGHHYCQ